MTVSAPSWSVRTSRRSSRRLKRGSNGPTYRRQAAWTSCPSRPSGHSGHSGHSGVGVVDRRTGTCRGLAIVRQIVEQHGGTIALRCGPNQAYDMNGHTDVFAAAAVGEEQQVRSHHNALCIQKVVRVHATCRAGVPSEICVRHAFPIGRLLLARCRLFPGADSYLASRRSARSPFYRPVVHSTVANLRRPCCHGITA